MMIYRGTKKTIERKNIDNMRSERTGPAKNRIKKTTKNYQKPNDDNQTYNKSRNKDMNEE
jgi:iron-sulfur cluster repair protein YtfE (RIC family)